MKVSVIGGGSWGTALSTVLANNGHEVHLLVRSTSAEVEINSSHKNSKYLPEITLPNNIIASTSYASVLSNTELILLVVPSHALRETIQNMKPFLQRDSRLMHSIKGIENESLKTMCDILTDELSTIVQTPISVLSGPSHAEEVARNIPTTVVVSNSNLEIAKSIQTIFMNDYFRVYTNTDTIGVEIGGALKNIIALGAGISDGLGYGDNGKAALLTRGLSEISKVGIALGGKSETFSGLSGMGDLIVTCTSQHSRNWKTGYLLSQGGNLESIQAQIGMVSEGVKTTKSAYSLSKSLHIDTPIIDAIYQILFESKNARYVSEQLMKRVFKEEF